jgi:hypothetical protein
MDAVLFLIDISSTVDHITINQHRIMEMIDSYLTSYEYDEAMARGLTDDEYNVWYGLLLAEVTECAMNIARTMYPTVKLELLPFATMYPNGYILAVHRLADDGLYVDLTSSQ